MAVDHFNDDPSWKDRLGGFALVAFSVDQRLRYIDMQRSTDCELWYEDIERMAVDGFKAHMCRHVYSATD